MHFTTLVSLLAAAAVAVATNTVTFVSQDKLDRTVYFTPNAKNQEATIFFEQIAETKVPGLQNVTVEIPTGWQGNWYSVIDGEPVRPGMLGEVTFQGWNGITYFDVSAIIDANDKNNVKQMWPAGEEQPVSGCVRFPCNFAYYVWDDIQTKATFETDLFCSLGGDGDETLGRRSADVDDAPSFPRAFVEGRWARY